MLITFILEKNIVTGKWDLEASNFKYTSVRKKNCINYVLLKKKEKKKKPTKIALK